LVARRAGQERGRARRKFAEQDRDPARFRRYAQSRREGQRRTHHQHPGRSLEARRAGKHHAHPG